MDLRSATKDFFRRLLSRPEVERLRGRQGQFEQSLEEIRSGR